MIKGPSLGLSSTFSALCVVHKGRRLRQGVICVCRDIDSFIAGPRKAKGAKSKRPRETSFAAFLANDPDQDDQAAAASPDTDAAADADRLQPHHVPVLVLYGTEFGFCKEIAEKLRDQLRAKEPCWPVMVDMADFEDGALDLLQHQAGDGVPPSEARAFCDWLNSSNAPSLSDDSSTSERTGPLNFSVLAAGDKSYINFCACGRMLDAKFEALGAQRLHPRVDLNKEDWRSVDAWIDGVLSSISAMSLETAAELGGGLLQSGEASNAPPKAKKWSMSRPYWATVTAVESLCTITQPDDRDTVRVEMDLGDSGLRYTPGDALGVHPLNDAEAVEEVLQALGLAGREGVSAPSWHYEDARADASDDQLDLREALTTCYDLRSPRPAILELLSTITAEHHHNENDSAAANGNVPAESNASIRAKLKALQGDEAAFEEYLTPRHVIDVLHDSLPRDQPYSLPAESVSKLLACLRPLLPRLYSISSSMREREAGVQITVAAVRYDSLGRPRAGVASNFLAGQCQVGDKLPVYMSANPDFRLPPDPSTPIIMVGPGTGLAPFRSFIMERLLGDAAAQNDDHPSDRQPDEDTATLATTASVSEPGKAALANGQHSSSLSAETCLLFFGSRRRDQDYLYGPVLERWQEQGLISLHTAFSRQQAQKVYVQQRLREAGAQVWALLQRGAHFYVCGDAASMAGSVEQALLDIISQHQGHDGAAYLDRLRAEKRYQRDVWF
ncbi:hypothetical protein WJX73_004727 [Symbiochloris irregularis]|uniref:Uncharacterized protein n=1 Tax=Symbiochloris irregularis TaxID=706552 RepID=A0AAW1NKY0_9CHLO